MSVNKAILLGHVGKDPIIKSLSNDQGKLANFSLATTRSWTNKQTGERDSETQWHSIVVFNENLVNLVEKYVTKGSKIYLEGEIKTRMWTDKEGVERYVTEIVLPKFGGIIDLVGDTKKSNEKTEKREDHQNNSIENDQIPW